MVRPLLSKDHYYCNEIKIKPHNDSNATQIALDCGFEGIMLPGLIPSESGWAYVLLFVPELWDPAWRYVKLNNTLAKSWQPIDIDVSCLKNHSGVIEVIYKSQSCYDRVVSTPVKLDMGIWSHRKPSITAEFDRLIALASPTTQRFFEDAFSSPPLVNEPGFSGPSMTLEETSRWPKD